MAGIKIAVVSGKGGTGKTSVSTALFDALVKNGRRVDFMDCDVEEPNAAIFLSGEVEAEEDVNLRIPVIDAEACTFCGRCVNFCQAHAILMVKNISHIAVMEDLCTGCGACVYACNDGAITEKNKAIGKVRRYRMESGRFYDGIIHIGTALATPVIKAVKGKIDEEAVTVIDAPPGTSCPVIETVEGADYVVLVTEPTPFGFHDLKLMAETLRQTGHDFGVVVNRAGFDFEELYNYLNDNEIELLMEIPFQREIAGNYAEGRVITTGNENLRTAFLEMYEKIEKRIKERREA